MQDNCQKMKEKSKTGKNICQRHIRLISVIQNTLYKNLLKLLKPKQFSSYWYQNLTSTSLKKYEDEK